MWWWMTEWYDFFWAGDVITAPLWRVILTTSEGMFFSSLLALNVESSCLLLAVFVIVLNFLSLLILLASSRRRGAPRSQLVTVLLRNVHISTRAWQWHSITRETFPRKNGSPHRFFFTVGRIYAISSVFSRKAIKTWSKMALLHVIFLYFKN